jgi:hypothetical protein
LPGGIVSVSDGGAPAFAGGALSAPGLLRNRAPHFAQTIRPVASAGVVTAALHRGHFIEK